ARGQWRLRDERITHPGLNAFLNANYTSDAEGSWLVNNGPQRVYVRLELAPLVLRLEPDGGLLTHTGRRVQASTPVCINEAGRVIIATDAGPGAVDDRDLAAFIDELRDAADRAPNDDTLLACVGGDTTIALTWRGLPVEPCSCTELPARFGFRLDPQPGSDERSAC
ncbi:MAG TPA: DUF2946 family protein, partial [Thauera sp.]|nr:DUF2946 family protein [Thauera sp.]